jgi:hypothetical protein
MKNLGRDWGRNVRNRGYPGRRAHYPECMHTLVYGLPTGSSPRKPAPLLDPCYLSTEKTALIIITKEE